jgi:hypothetical protein
MIAAAAAGSLTPGSWIEIWSSPCVLISGSAHDRHRPVEVLLGELAVARRDRLQRHLEAALQVEAERRPLLERRPRDRKQPDPDEGRSDERDDEDCSAAGHVRRLRVAATGPDRGWRSRFARRL